MSGPQDLDSGRLVAAALDAAPPAGGGGGYCGPEKYTSPPRIGIFRVSSGAFLYLKTKEAKTNSMAIKQHRISPSSSLYSKGGNTLQKVGTVAVHII